MSDTAKSAREIIAGKLFDRYNQDFGGANAGMFLGEADNIIAALRAAGFKIMLRDPSPGVYGAGLRPPPPELTCEGKPVIGWAFADELYKSMWDAAP